MDHSAAPPLTSDPIMNEFVMLNRRRLFGAPPLDLEDLERWQKLRRDLSQRFGDRLDGMLSVTERRANFRFPTHIEVCFDAGSELRSAGLENVSEGGMFVMTEQPLPVETPLQISLRLPDGVVTISGRVAWTRPVSNGAGPAGMGVRFENLSEAQREQIAAVVALVPSRARRA